MLSSFVCYMYLVICSVQYCVIKNCTVPGRHSFYSPDPNLAPSPFPPRHGTNDRQDTRKAERYVPRTHECPRHDLTHRNTFISHWLSIIKIFLRPVAPGIAVGDNKGRALTPLPKKFKPSHRKGLQKKGNSFVKGVIREVVGFSPYERRVLELLRNNKDKKARKLTKKRVRISPSSNVSPRAEMSRSLVLFSGRNASWKNSQASWRRADVQRTKRLSSPLCLCIPSHHRHQQCTLQPCQRSRDLDRLV